MKKIIITGAGSLGRGFIDYFLRDKNNHITVIDNNEWSLAELKDISRNNKNLKLILDDCKFAPEGDLLIHTAAYKHVDLVEDNPNSSFENNVVNTQKLFVHNTTKKKIFISTDKAVYPKGEYGKQKALAEDYARRWGGVIVRMGNLKGSSGSIYPLWENQILEDKPLTITDWKMKRYFIDIQEAVEKIMNLYPRAKPGDIIIPDCGEEVLLKDIVNQVLTIHNKPLDYPVKIIGIKKGEKLRESLTWVHEKCIYTDKFGSIYES